MPALSNSSAKRVFIVLLCLLLGTWLGVFFQHFDSTARLFKNIADLYFNFKELNIILFRFSFSFGIKLNLGTIIGGIVGIWFLR